MAVGMTTPESADVFDDEFDLRSYLDRLVRYKWLVTGTAAAFIVLGALVSFLQPASYESTVVVSLPAAQGECEFLGPMAPTVERLPSLTSSGRSPSICVGLGLQPSAYKEFANNAPVMNKVGENLGLQVNTQPLPGSYEVQLKYHPTSFDGISFMDEGFLVVIASANTPVDSFSLAQEWPYAFDSEVITLLEGQLARKQAASEQVATQISHELADAENLLGAMDQQVSLSLLESQLSSLERGLVSDEEQLRRLTTNLIPTDEAKLSFLVDSLGSTLQTLGPTQGMSVILSEGSPGTGVPSNDVTVLNPVYLLLSEDLATTRTQLFTNRLEAEHLDKRIPVTQTAIDQLREEVVVAKTERQRLSRTILETESRYNAIQAERDRVRFILPRLPELAHAEVLHTPLIPESPVGPHSVQIIAMAAALGVLLGVFFAIFLGWYRTPSSGRYRKA
jgi:hypothetical protein